MEQERKGMLARYCQGTSTERITQLGIRRAYYNHKGIIRTVRLVDNRVIVNRELLFSC